MKTTLTFDVPNELESALRVSGYTPERLQDETRYALAAILFTRKLLSLGQAAQLAEMSLWNFISFLGEQGVVVADYDTDEAEKEIEAARWLSQNQ
jgi:predicted HTH domain antitoxin